MRRNKHVKAGKAQLRAKSRGDWTLPGYNYLGPGNPVDDFPPQNEDDAIARDHDMDYQDILDSGQNPYLRYSNADEKARKKFGHSIGGYIGKAAFTVKKYIAPRINEHQVRSRGR